MNGLVLEEEQSSNYATFEDNGYEETLITKINVEEENISDIPHCDGCVSVCSFGSDSERSSQVQISENESILSPLTQMIGNNHSMTLGCLKKVKSMMYLHLRK